MNKVITIDNGGKYFNIDLKRNYHDTNVIEWNNNELRFLGLKGKYLRYYHMIYKSKNYKTILCDYKKIYNHCNNDFNNAYQRNSIINANPYLINSKYLDTIQKVRKAVNVLMNMINANLSLYTW